MCTDLLLNIDWPPASFILPMDINVLCVRPVRICPLRVVPEIFGSASLHAMYDCVWLPLGSPTVIVVPVYVVL